jgi:signal transduction histidine kinase
MIRLFSGLRFRLLLLVVLACTPLVVLTLHTAWEDRRRARTAWRQRGQKLIQVANREEDKLLGETQQLLLAMAESSQALLRNPRGAKKLMDHLFTAYPRYSNLGVVLTNGDVLASAAPMPEASNQSGREYFRRTVANRAFSVGDYPTKRTFERPTVSFGYPVLDRSGQLQAVVFAALDLDWFNRFGTELQTQVPKGATWTAVNTNGAILVRYPGPEAWVGKSLPEKPLLNTVFNGGSGDVELANSQGEVWYYAYNAMHSQMVPGSVVAILGIPLRTLFADTDRLLVKNLAWLGAALAMGLTLGWIGSNLLVLLPVKALVRSTARLGAGDLSVRTGLPHGRDELGQLTDAFDQMAGALEQREAERRLTNNKLQVLSHRLVEVQESERRHIARELHDEIGQTLTVAEMNLQSALNAPEDPSFMKRLEESMRAVEQVLEQVHDLSLNLRPSMLDDLGLESTVRWYLNRQAAAAGLQVEFRAEPLEARLEPVIETGCFRVAQEALTNILRHAHASTVIVDLSRKNGRLNLSVRDDGVGFEVSAIRERAVRGASLGLLSMEERAALAGGGIEYISAPGEGTEVRAWFPLRWRPSPEETSGAI